MTKNDIYTNHRQCMSFHILILLINTGCAFLSAYYLAGFVDVFSEFSYIEGFNIIAKLGMVFGVQLFCNYMKNKCWKAYKEKRTNELECKVYEKYLSFLGKLDGESKLSVICEKDISECIEFFTNTIPLTVQAVVGILAYIVYFIVKDNGIGILILLMVLGGVQFLPPFIMKKYFIQNYIRAGQEEELLRQEVISGLSGIFTIKMLNLQQWFMKRYIQRQQIFQKVGERAAGTSSLQAALNSGVALVQQLGLLVIGIYCVEYNCFSLETLVEAYVLSSSFYQYIARLGEFKINFGVCKAAEERITSFLQECNRQHILQGIDFELPEKGIWLVKGENGAGKSTFFSILSGYNHSNENVTKNGKRLCAETRMQMTGWCPQLYLQLSEDFCELLAMIPNEEINADYLNKCIEQFGINTELLQKPLNQLSGGEQKKLMISLTLAKKGEVILLDEPEVSLDQAGVECLKALIENEKRLIFLITHLSVFDDIASGIIQVKGGNVYA